MKIGEFAFEARDTRHQTVECLRVRTTRRVHQRQDLPPSISEVEKNLARVPPAHTRLIGCGTTPRSPSNEGYARERDQPSDALVSLTQVVTNGVLDPRDRRPHRRQARCDDRIGGSRAFGVP